MDRISNNIMTVYGHGQVSATPDLAVVRLGVQTTGYNLSPIQYENSQISQQVIQAIRQLGTTDIKTSQYSIDKIYEYQDGKQLDRGYSVQNILEIKTKNINQVGTIIDVAVNMGSNKVLSIFFELSDSDLYYKHALNLAVDNAIQKAQTISSNLNVKLNSIPIRIIEGSAPSIPIPQYERELAATPILPGDIKIEAVITADFCYLQK